MYARQAINCQPGFLFTSSAIGFAGLGDEYYTSEVAFEDYYNLKVEPWEPNLTTLIDFDSKWKSMVDSTIPVPTPRHSDYSSKIGVFEGGGYVAKGIYSPMEDCRMKSNETPHFCPVCQKAIKEVILFKYKITSIIYPLRIY